MNSPRPAWEPAGWHCTRRPNRTNPRLVDAKAAARWVCKAIEHGATMEEVRKAVQDKCGIDCGNPECEEELRRIKQALELIQDAVISWIVWMLLFESAPFLGLARWLVKLLPARVLKLLGYTEKLKRLEELKVDSIVIRSEMERLAEVVAALLTGK